MGTKPATPRLTGKCSFHWATPARAVCGFFKRNCLGVPEFLPLTQCPLVFTAGSCGDLSSWHENPGLGGLVWGSSQWRYPLSSFYPCGCRTSPFHVCTPPTSLDGYDFFNSIVVRHPFSLISDVPEWWLFYILVVILMWLCKEASHVCPRCHLDKKCARDEFFNTKSESNVPL